MVAGSRAVLGVWIAVLGGCLRAPLSSDGGDDGLDESASTGATGADDVDGLGMSGPLLPSDSGADDGTDDSAASCHPSYVPCLPVVDDLDCDDVRALDAAPVQVVGDDPYGLDADHDGIGCEG